MEEQGNLKASAEEEDRRNAEFLQRLTRHIQLRKVVQLEEVSAEFGTTTADIVDKIKALEQMRELNGLIDERGKYIYLKQTEIDVRDFAIEGHHQLHQRQRQAHAPGVAERVQSAHQAGTLQVGPAAHQGGRGEALGSHPGRAAAIMN